MCGKALAHPVGCETCCALNPFWPNSRIIRDLIGERFPHDKHFLCIRQTEDGTWKIALGMAQNDQWWSMAYLMELGWAPSSCPKNGATGPLRHASSRSREIGLSGRRVWRLPGLRPNIFSTFVALKYSKSHKDNIKTHNDPSNSKK